MNETSDSKFVARKWNIVNDQSSANSNPGNKIIYNTEVLKSNFCDYNNAYMLVRDNITIAGHNLATEVAFKNFTPFTKCIRKTSGTTIDDAEDLDLAMPMYNLIEYSSTYSYGLILKMKKLILMIIILKIQTVSNLSSIMLNY